MMRIAFRSPQYSGAMMARPRFGEALISSDEPKLTISQKKTITETAVRALRQRIAEDQPGSPIAGVPITVTPFAVQREASVVCPDKHLGAVGDFIAGLQGILENEGSGRGQAKRNFKFYPDAIGDRVNVINVRV
jgi:hypothetical protein